MRSAGRLLLLMPRRTSGGTPTASYLDTVLAADPLAVWSLSESAGTTADNAEGTSSLDGTYTGATLANATGPDGVLSCPLFDGSSDYVDIGTAALLSAFSGTAGTLMAWGKVSGSGVWTDGGARNLAELAVDNSNRVILQKSNNDNTLTFTYAAGGTVENISATYSATSWFNVVITWDKNAGASGEVKAYLNGSQTGSTAQTLGTWSGTLDAARCRIGSRNSTPLNPWDGWLAFAAIWTSALTALEVAAVAEV